MPKKSSLGIQDNTSHLVETKKMRNNFPAGVSIKISLQIHKMVLRQKAVSETIILAIQVNFFCSIKIHNNLEILMSL